VIRSHYGDRVFAARIRQNIRLAEAPSHQTHIFAYDPSSAGAEDYSKLADEVLKVRDVKSAAPIVPPPPPVVRTEYEADIDTVEPELEPIEVPEVTVTEEAPPSTVVEEESTVVEDELPRVESPEGVPTSFEDLPTSFEDLPTSFEDLPTAPRIREATERPPLVFPIVPAPNGSDDDDSSPE